MGRVRLEENYVNLPVPGSHTLTVTIDKEEGFADQVLILVDGLPEGLKAAYPSEQPAKASPEPRALPYAAESRQVNVVLVATEKALQDPLPKLIQFKAQPMADSRLGREIPIGSIPLMLVRNEE